LADLSVGILERANRRLARSEITSDRNGIADPTACPLYSVLSKQKSNICIVLPGPLSYSETFLQAHVDRLSATVNWLERFPVDTANEYPIQMDSGTSEKLRQKFKASLHGYVLNPAKKFYLRNFFRQNNISVVLAEYGMVGTAALGICRELAIPLVVHFHGYDAYSRPVLDKYQEIYKQMFAYCSAIIAVSRHMIDQLIKIGAPREKVCHNAYGVDVTQFQQASLLTSPLQVIAVGRFVEKKAPYLTILAFKKVLERLPEVKLVMIGGGVLHDVCSKIIKSLHVEHAVELTGAVSHDHVARLMQQSRIFVQHSLVPKSGDSEGTPVGILEASASGLPVVSTRHTGIIDAVVHGKTGFLVDEGDIDGMSEYMYQLLTDPKLAAEMGKRAREYISENFNMDSSIKNLRAILDKYAL
jgi:colanic acid/amylovoran biosynthesis glycosyltransferase